MLPISAVSCSLSDLKSVLVIISLPPPVSEARIEDAGRKGLQGESIYCHFHSSELGYCILFLDEQWRKSILGAWQTPEVSGVRVKEFVHPLE